jgi:hypothetical protein
MIKPFPWIKFRVEIVLVLLLGLAGLGRFTGISGGPDSRVVARSIAI